MESRSTAYLTSCFFFIFILVYFGINCSVLSQGHSLFIVNHYVVVKNTFSSLPESNYLS